VFPAVLRGVPHVAMDGLFPILGLMEGLQMLVICINLDT
jgi:hypothetical protein